MEVGKGGSEGGSEGGREGRKGGREGGREMLILTFPVHLNDSAVNDVNDERCE